MIFNKISEYQLCGFRIIESPHIPKDRAYAISGNLFINPEVLTILFSDPANPILNYNPVKYEIELAEVAPCLWPLYLIAAAILLGILNLPPQ